MPRRLKLGESGRNRHGLDEGRRRLRRRNHRRRGDDVAVIAADAGDPRQGCHRPARGSPGRVPIQLGADGLGERGHPHMLDLSTGADPIDAPSTRRKPLPHGVGAVLATAPPRRRPQLPTRTPVGGAGLPPARTGADTPPTTRSRPLNQPANRALRRAAAGPMSASEGGGGAPAPRVWKAEDEHTTGVRATAEAVVHPRTLDLPTGVELIDALLPHGAEAAPGGAQLLLRDDGLGFRG